jgi:hypothetical protein
MKFFVEITDTYGGEANYSWVKRFLVSAKTIRGAIVKVSKNQGMQGTLRRVENYGDHTRHDVQGACICVFCGEANGDEVSQYSRVITL